MDTFELPSYILNNSLAKNDVIRYRKQLRETTNGEDWKKKIAASIADTYTTDIYSRAKVEQFLLS